MTAISTTRARRREQILILDEGEQTSALVTRLTRRAEVVVAGSVEEALTAAFTWMFEVDLVIGVLGEGASAFADVIDLAVALPGAPIAVVSDDEQLRAEATRRGCIVALSSAAAASEESGRHIEEIVAASSRSDQWPARVTQIRALFSAIDIGIVVVSPTGRVVIANPLAHEVLGMTRAELMYHRHPGLPLSTLDGKAVPEDDQPFARVRESGKETGVLEYVLSPEAAEERILELRGRPVEATGLGEHAVLLTVRDVTEAHDVRRALVSAERRDSLLLEHAAEGYLVLDEWGLITEVSSTLNRHFRPEQLVGSDALLLLHPDERARATEMFIEVRETKRRPLRAEIRVIDGFGEERWVEVTMTNRLDEPSIGGVVLNLRDISERKMAEESMARLSAIVEWSEDSIIAESLEGTILSWNPASTRLYGYEAEEAIGASAMALLVPERHQPELYGVWQRIRHGERVERRDTVHRRKDGTSFVVSVHVSPLYDANGQLVGTSTIARDVSERRRLEEERSMFEQRFRVGFERGAIGMAMLDLGRRFTSVNRALCTMLGRDEAELIGRSADGFLHPLEVQPFAETWNAIVTGGAETAHADRRFVSREGVEVWASVDSAMVRDADGEPLYVFAQVQDITDRRNSEQALAHQALHDSLTGLPNRALLCDRLGQAIDRSSRYVTQVALLFLDLDRFKLVNDGLGHAAGDLLLVDIAMRMAKALRRSDTVARFGGDEFVVMREEVDATEAVQLGNRINDLFREPFEVDGTEVYITASCGVVLVSGDSIVDDALRDADAAMYRAKERGGARVELFNPELRRAVAQRFDLEQALAFAIERDEFRVVYQPIVSMDTGCLVGAEALVRWEQPDRGTLLPADFIPAAEETGHITSIGAFVLREGLAQVMRWRDALPGAESMWVSVNLSSRQLALADPVDLSAESLRELDAPADALRLELTESAVMEDVDAAISLLGQLRLLGIKIAIDDFGTGHSSLSYLSRLPISSLKIDHSFVWALGPKHEDAAIVRAIVSLADTLHIEPCAEGVETEEQRRVLGELGCGLAQGYLFAPPMEPEQFENWVRNQLAPAAVG